jgi:hypothetical protein
MKIPSAPASAYARALSMASVTTASWCSAAVAGKTGSTCTITCVFHHILFSLTITHFNDSLLIWSPRPPNG